MNARARIHAMFPLDESAEYELDSRLDDYRTEAITKAVGRLRAVPVTCTALTGPVWYGNGWNDAIRTFEEIADYQKPDDEAYPGELQRLRALNLGLRAALLRRDDMEWARQQLISHAVYEAQARGGEAQPDFFEPGHTYSHVDDGTDWRFRCDTVTTHPEDGGRTALGWKFFKGVWSECAYGVDDWEIHLLAGISDVTEAVTR